MWQVVRRELARLEWDAAPPLTQDLVSDWGQTVPSMVAIRRVLGPVFAHDPLALLATATTGAARTTGAELTVAPSLHDVRAALAGVARVMKVASDDDRRRQVATLNHVAYELAHWVRVRTTNDRAKAWLLAGETALDSAIHAPAGRSAIGVGLAAWQDALAAVHFGEGWIGYTPKDGRFEEGPIGAEFCRLAIDESLRVDAWGTVVCSNAAPQHAMWFDVALQQQCNEAFLAKIPIQHRR